MQLAPDILPPAFFPVGLNVSGRRCVVIGPPTDREAIDRVADLRSAGADVIWFDDPAGVREADVRDAFLVLSTPQDARLSSWLREMAGVHRFLLCAIDQPAYGFVALPATVRAGPARIGIWTGGVSPRVGRIVKAALQGALDATFVRFLACLARQRRLNRARHANDGSARRAAMVSAAEGFEVRIELTYPPWFLDELQLLRPRVISPEEGG
jgi:siroheme synthase (precorrin-2 oxidase/ferrochelatase)